jgi:thermitase
MRSVAAVIAALSLSCALAGQAPAARGPNRVLFAVAYRNDGALEAAVGGRVRLVRRVASLRIAEVRAPTAFAAHARRVAGIASVQRIVPRRSTAEPALLGTFGPGLPYEWQFAATHEDAVPDAVLRAASAVTIAVIDSGADTSAPDLAAKSPRTFNLVSGTSDVRDAVGHGTFVASLAAGSVTNGEGIAGFGGDAELLVVKAIGDNGALSDVEEASAIAYAVDHGARIINLSVGGTRSSFAEQRAIEYAVAHRVLVVAAAGNEYDLGDPVEYPAALLQPAGSDGHGGSGLAVGASTMDGSRASFSNTGSQLSLVAPGEDVFGAVSSLSSPDLFPRSPLPGSRAGSYGFASGTSFSAPEVAGAAALVMAADPKLHVADVAEILKSSASNHGAWNADTGYGVLDAGAAVREALRRAGVRLSATRTRGRVRLAWSSLTGVAYRISVWTDRGASRVLVRSTTAGSSSFAVQPRHRYAFTVTALDAGGTAIAASTRTVRG